jgi:succinate dehydrogenase/fumarate reductase flavoprotein subunit
VAGCRAAIAARQRGATVAVADRGFTKRSGEGGAGVDHWHGAVTIPARKITPDGIPRRRWRPPTVTQTAWPLHHRQGGLRHAARKARKWASRSATRPDEFKGSIFRDEETKLLFAYDLENKHCLRVYGYNIKPCVDAEMRRLGARVYDRVCITSLLTEGGRRGARVVGATGISDRPGAL